MFVSQATDYQRINFFSWSRIEELLKIVNDDTPAEDKDSVELVLLSNQVADYEEEHFPI